MTEHSINRASSRSRVAPTVLRQCSAGALLALALVGPATAQTAPAPSAPSSEDKPLVLEDFVVSGFRNSLAASLDEKRKATTIVDVITAEDVGKFPDTNVAESLSHLPGVTVDRLFGQGERVSINGTDPNLSRTLLNGQTVATGDWFILDQPSRQFNYTLLAPEVIGKANVYKAWEASLPEGSVGGTIVLHTRNPLDLKPFTYVASVTGMYNSREDESLDFGGSQIVSWRNDSKTFGVLLGLQSAREHIRRDGIEALGMVDNAAAVVPTGGGLAVQSGGLTPLPASGASIVNAVNFAYFNQVRSRKGGNIVLSFRPTENLSFEFNGLKVKKTDHNQNNSFYLFPGATNWGGPYDSAGNPVNHRGTYSNVRVVGGIVDAATIADAPIVQDVFNRKAEIDTEAFDAKATFKAGDWSISPHIGTTEATSGTYPQYFVEFFAPSGGTATVSGLTTANPSMELAGYSNANMLAGGGWSGNMAYAANGDKEDYAQIDFQRALRGTGSFKSIQFGAKTSEHETFQDSGAGAFIPPGTATFTPADLGGKPLPGNFGDGLGVHPSVKSAVLVPDAGVLLDRVSNAPGANGQTLQQSIFTGAYAWPVASWKITERVNAAYVQTSFGREKMNGNFGVRFARTETTGEGFAGPAVWASPSQVQPVRTKHTYDNFLPALNLAYSLQNDMDLRFAVARVIARPNFADLSTSAWTNDTIKSGQAGNPSLDPYESTNIDASFDWYFTKNSVFSASVFYKNIDNYIVQGTAQVSAPTQAGVPTLFNMNVPVNGGKATSRGFSLTYQQPFANGFGIQAHYTFLDTEAPTSGIDTSSTSLKIAAFNSGTTKGVTNYIPGVLPWASDHTFNVSPYYENERFLARLTYSWRSEYFTGFNRGVACFTQDTTQFDANLSLKLHRRLTVSLAGLNLTDETYLQYGKLPAQVFQYAYKTGRRYQVGVHFKL